MARDRAFSTLSARGQAYRLRALAYAALPAFAVEPVRVRLISNHLNGIFRVDAADGRAYALRISHPTWRTDADLETEIAWLVALAAETDVGAPVPLPTRDGARVTVASAPGVPEPRRCVLFTWLPGVDLIHRLTPAYLSQLGVLAALLHAHAARFQAPPCLPQRRMDRIYARGEPDVLFTATSAAFFTPGTGAIFAAVRERVDAAFARRYADPVGLHLIHNDLHQENVKVHQGRLYPLDFEDALWGYPVQDIAMTFSDLLFYTRVSHDEFSALRAAFLAGYESVAPWPEAYPGEIDTFIAGRQLWRANYVARFQPEHGHGFMTAMAGRLEQYLATGAFTKA